MLRERTSEFDAPDVESARASRETVVEIPKPERPEPAVQLLKLKYASAERIALHSRKAMEAKCQSDEHIELLRQETARIKANAKKYHANAIVVAAALATLGGVFLATRSGEQSPPPARETPVADRGDKTQGLVRGPVASGPPQADELERKYAIAVQAAQASAARAGALEKEKQGLVHRIGQLESELLRARASNPPEMDRNSAELVQTLLGKLQGDWIRRADDQRHDRLRFSPGTISYTAWWTQTEETYRFSLAENRYELLQRGIVSLNVDGPGTPTVLKARKESLGLQIEISDDTIVLARFDRHFSSNFANYCDGTWARTKGVNPPLPLFQLKSP